MGEGSQNYARNEGHDAGLQARLYAQACIESTRGMSTKASDSSNHALRHDLALWGLAVRTCLMR